MMRFIKSLANEYRNDEAVGNRPLNDRARHARMKGLQARVI